MRKETCQAWGRFLLHGNCSVRLNGKSPVAPVLSGGVRLPKATASGADACVMAAGGKLSLVTAEGRQCIFRGVFFWSGIILPVARDI